MWYVCGCCDCCGMYVTVMTAVRCDMYVTVVTAVRWGMYVTVVTAVVCM